ncbi:MAG: HAD family hydrolase [Bacteroidia bacterium]|nr:HAD family hydrolase [Bacteroidia bacterium]
MYSEILLEGVKGVLIDLDDTIYKYETCHRYSLEICMKKLSEESGLDIEACIGIYTNCRKQINTQLHGQAASHSRLLYFQLIWEKINGRTDFAKTLEFEKLYWDTFITRMQVETEALHFLNLCFEKKIPVVIVTDLTTEIQLRKIIQLKIEHYIKFIVSSEEAGEEKPGAKPFNYALNKLGLTSTEVIMVGDNDDKDRIGAENAGIRYYHPF